MGQGYTANYSRSNTTALKDALMLLPASRNTKMTNLATSSTNFKMAAGTDSACAYGHAQKGLTARASAVQPRAQNINKPHSATGILAQS